MRTSPWTGLAILCALGFQSAAGFAASGANASEMLDDGLRRAAPAVPAPSSSLRQPEPIAGPEFGRAGLVVQGRDGEVQTFCLDLKAESRSGMELLRMAGLDVTVQSFGPGVAVCSIGGEGCAYPGEPCWCECKSLGGGCSYWAYHSLEGSVWRYSALGPTGRRAMPGDVDGWAWGPGTLVAGTAPPVHTFDEICAEQERSPDPNPEATTFATRPPEVKAQPLPTLDGSATAGPDRASTHAEARETAQSRAEYGAGDGDERVSPNDEDGGPAGRDAGAGTGRSSARNAGGGDAAGPAIPEETPVPTKSAPALAVGDDPQASESLLARGEAPPQRISRKGRSATSANAPPAVSAIDGAGPGEPGRLDRTAQLDRIAFLAVLGLLSIILVAARRA